MTPTVPGNKHTPQNILNWSFDPDYNVLVMGLLGLDGSTLRYVKVNSSGQLIPTGAMDLGNYDYISANYSGATSDVYTFKSGGSGGTTTATITINWTTTDKDVLSTVVKT